MRLSLPAALAALMSGCLSQQHPLEIIAANGTDLTTCLPATDTLVYGGVLDVGVTDAAFAVSMTVENTFQPNLSATEFRTNTLDVTIERANTRYEGLDGAAVSAPAKSVPVFAFAKAGGQVSLALVPLAPKDVVAATKTLPGIIAVVRFAGRTTDGTAVATPEVRFPINYCTGCSSIPSCFVPNDPANPDDPNSTTDDPLVESDDADGPLIAPEFACGGADGKTAGTAEAAVCPLVPAE